MGQDFALVEQGGSGDVGDHVSRREARVGAEECGEALVDVGVDEAVDAAFADAG